MKPNPIIRSTITVFGFWWLVLTVIALWNAGFVLATLETVAMAALTSLAVVVVGFLLGFLGVLIWRSAHSLESESMLKRGDAWNGATSNLGPLPRLSIPAMGELPKGINRHAPWMNKLHEAFPLHAKAAVAVIRVMMTEPDLPASPVPGGHAGRTLYQHSLGVVESMLEEAPKWVYRGQFNAEKKLMVPPTDGAHRFVTNDWGLLILTALAHDIGKITCYKLVAPNTVVEVKPNHDIEGGKLLRRIPEVMALPLEDRRALLTACTYYHHPYAMPVVAWCNDRVRSLTELLIVADHATGRKEGQVQTQPARRVEDDATITDLERRKAAELGAVIGVDIENNIEAGRNLFDAEHVATPTLPKTPTVGQWEMGDGDEEGVAAAAAQPEIAGLYRLLANRKDLVNGNNANHRLAYKRGPRLYVCEPRLRETIQASESYVSLEQGESGWQPGMREVSPLTARLLYALGEAGLLLQAIDVPNEDRVAHFDAAWSMYSIRTQLNKSKAPGVLIAPFFVIPAKAFGLDEVEDWPFDITIVKPFFGWRSERGFDVGTEDTRRKKYLERLRAELHRQQAVPEKVLADGTWVFYADSMVAQMIPIFLADNNLQESDLGMTRANGIETGREVIKVPCP